MKTSRVEAGLNAVPLRLAVPKPGRRHPLPQALAMPLGQLLGRQRRIEVGMITADQGQDVVALESTDAVVRGSAAQFTAHCWSAFVTDLAEQALDLPLTETK